MADFVLTEEICEALAQAAKKKSRTLGVGVSLSICDENGNLRLLQRFGDAILPSLEISPKKAYTAAVLRQSTAEFGKIAQVGGSAFGINVTNDKLVIFGGGFPLQVKGKTVGGIGVSGGSVAEDEEVAQAVLKAFAELGGD
ncbi:MAG: heme-binding protein [Treponema sp.]|nr:heme-binding protein [Treponema sp.]